MVIIIQKIQKRRIKTSSFFFADNSAPKIGGNRYVTCNRSYSGYLLSVFADKINSHGEERRLALRREKEKDKLYSALAVGLVCGIAYMVLGPVGLAVVALYYLMKGR